MTLTTATKPAITATRLPRSNVHFNFAVSSRAPIGSHHETFLAMPMKLEIPKSCQESLLDQEVHQHLDATCSEAETDVPFGKLPAISPACVDKTNCRQSLVSSDRAIAGRGTMARMLVP